MPSSASNASIGIDLNDLRMRDSPPLCINSDSFKVMVNS